jgi:hypothetical protein
MFAVMEHLLTTSFEVLFFEKQFTKFQKDLQFFLISQNPFSIKKGFCNGELQDPLKNKRF